MMRLDLKNVTLKNGRWNGFNCHPNYLQFFAGLSKYTSYTTRNVSLHARMFHLGIMETNEIFKKCHYFFFLRAIFIFIIQRFCYCETVFFNRLSVHIGLHNVYLYIHYTIHYILHTLDRNYMMKKERHVDDAEEKWS